MPSPAPAVAELCAHLSNHLPQRLESLKPRVVSPRSPLVHAWGDPPVRYACGVPPPAGYSPKSSETTAVDGIRWFEQPSNSVVVWTALWPATASSPAVDVRLAIPTAYDGQGAYLVDLASPLKESLPR